MSDELLEDVGEVVAGLGVIVFLFGILSAIALVGGWVREAYGPPGVVTAVVAAGLVLFLAGWGLWKWGRRGGEQA